MSRIEAVHVSRRTARLAGAALLAYGVVGLILTALTLSLSGPLVARASLAADSAGDSLAAAAKALDQTTTAFDGFGHSLDDARGSSQHAAQLMRDASGTTGQLADGMSISVFGAQPFLSLAQSFRRNSDELRQVSEDMTKLSNTLGQNQQDVAAVRTSIGQLRDRVNALARDAAARPGDPSVGPSLAIAVYGIAIWLGVLALAAMGTGIALLRAGS